jgi:dUTP pyrophosphatase
MAFSKGLVLANGTGIIDSDYTDQLYLMIANISLLPSIIYNGDRIAQAMLVKTLDYTLEESLDPVQQKTDRKGGLGSTGK